MRTSNFYGCTKFGGGRCQSLVPLIELCDGMSQLKLNLSGCGECSTPISALLLRKGGCIEYEVVCEPAPILTCCGVVDNRPQTHMVKRSRQTPKPAIIYPLHTINEQGLSVFVLDGKLKELGYGRWHAVLLTGEKTNYKKTDMMFNIDYYPFRTAIASIEAGYFQSNLEDC